ncbi:hypothetical protein NM688_g7910 [Phlebia brevispora]|uniref:Uncharacterized protein n=1 Tax=Phlebia brevispora TaxID=194682 RepID=A0ACC1RZQ2_9APHY|nr:hypothetical protein NM688_g7910 [Phlebia brevispora]
MASTLTSFVGYVILATSVQKSVGAGYFALFLVIGGNFSLFPLVMSWAANVFSPTSKRGVGTAFIVSISNCVSIASPQVYFDSNDLFRKGHAISAACLFVSCLAALALKLRLTMLNRRNAAALGRTSAEAEAEKDDDEGEAAATEEVPDTDVRYVFMTFALCTCVPSHAIIDPFRYPYIPALYSLRVLVQSVTVLDAYKSERLSEPAAFHVCLGLPILSYLPVTPDFLISTFLVPSFPGFHRFHQDSFPTTLSGGTLRTPRTSLSIAADMDIEQFRKAGYQAIDRICDYYYSLQDRPVASQVHPGYLREALPSSAPEEGEDFQLIADDYQKYIIPGLTHWQHPSFFGYFPTACTFEGILGDLYSTSATNPGFNWACSPACTELEAIVMDWSAKLFGLADHFLNSGGVGGGVMQTTASDSALVAVIAARSLYTSTHPAVKLEDLVIYTTTQTHSLGVKAGLVLGLACRTLEVSAEDQYALRGDTLRKALEEDEAQGKHPFILIATVGTTSSGAIDRLEEIAEVVRDHPSLWIHVDAAWAGITLSCPEYREVAKLEWINKIGDSFCTNFHKWGLVNFDASTLWVRNRKHLTDALDVTPEFLRTKQGDAGTVIDYRNWHIALGRRFRSLKVWFVLRSYGVHGFQKHIRDAIELNKHFASLVTESPTFSLVTEPSFALSVFRLQPPAAASIKPDELEQRLNELNQAFYRRVTARPDILLTQTKLNGTFCIRFAIGAVRTKKEHVDRAWALIQEEAAVAVKEWCENLGIKDNGI